MTVAAPDLIARFTECQPLFTALGDERRQIIVIMLLESGGARNVADIAERLQLSQPATSHHLKILRDARLLSVERRGTQRLYALNSPECTTLLAPMKELVELITECTSAT